ncbi:ABC transporter ATP-binding protein [Thermincola ferriacetica]|uniref:ABC transporter ATP-binding protein n=1 Tax=Thermincola ferriacetica TaxID=281456 RepID=UPI001FA784F1|nr:energy-coupling factor transporter ATPase [Thermincola ferriacetica]
METLPLFEIKNLIYYYPDIEKPALNNINLIIEEGEFLLVAGGSGSGKSSLARALAGLIPDFYGGKFGGKVLFQGRNLREIDRRSLAREVGIVFQDPEKQLVMTSVEAEIAFGLENLSLPQDEMFRRVAEVMSFLDLSAVKDEFTGNLSGGQKQRLALASVLAMQPKVLILDEPTSQLDPVAAEELLNLVKRLNEEMGLTIILIEQRLERCFHVADRLIIMECGEILKGGPADEVARWEVEKSIPFIPPVAKFFASLGASTIPLTVKEGRKALKPYYSMPGARANRTASAPLPNKRDLKVRSKPGQENRENTMVELKNVWFTYPGGREALRNVNCRIEQKEFVVILGENAAGKSTLLKHVAGLLKPGRGSVSVMGRETGKTPLAELARYVGYLSQNPNDYLFQDTVEEELLFTLKNFGLSDFGRIENLLDKLNLSHYRTANPRDLSSGERQRVALAAVLASRPLLLLLDEPTRGIDYRLKNELGDLLSELREEGITIIMVTHDIEFAAEYADRVILMFDGRVVNTGSKREVLGGSVFYSPQMSRLFRGTVDGILTVAEAIEEMRELQGMVRDGTHA